MNKKPYSQVFDVVAHDLIPDSVDLAPRIITHIQKGKGVFVQPKLKLLAAALAVVTVFIVLLANGPAVVHALQNLFGYIPGLGTVASDSSLRTLAEPVSQTRKDVTIMVKQGSIDDDRTVLSLVFPGLDFNQVEHPDMDGPCGMEPENMAQLRLPDGVELKLINASSSPDGEIRFYFAALPPGSNEAILEMPCLWASPFPNDWQVQLRFVPATGLKPFPVIEIASPTPGTQTSSIQSPYDIWLTLEQVVPLDDGYIFMGNMKWNIDEDTPRFEIDHVYPVSIQVVDANGRKLQGKMVPPELGPDSQNLGREQFPWAFQVSGKEYAWPLTLTVETAEVWTNAGGYLSFELVPGPNPQVGQTWILNKDLTDFSPYGHNIHMNSATLSTDPKTGQPLLQFDAQSDPDVLALRGSIHLYNNYVYVEDKTSHNLPQGHVGWENVFLDGLPTDERWEFSLDYIAFRMHGDWQVTWQP